MLVTILLTLLGVVWLGLVVLAVGLCMVAARADRRVASQAEPLRVPMPRTPPQIPARDVVPPSSGSSGAA